MRDFVEFCEYAADLDDLELAVTAALMRDTNRENLARWIELYQAGYRAD